MSYMKQELEKSLENVNWQSLANDFIDDYVAQYGLQETILRLFDFGLTDVQVVALDFPMETVLALRHQYENEFKFYE